MKYQQMHLVIMISLFHLVIMIFSIPSLFDSLYRLKQHEFTYMEFKFENIIISPQMLYICKCFQNEIIFRLNKYLIFQKINSSLSMSQYNKILQAFKNLGYSETSTLQEYQLNKALDKINAASGGAHQFDRDVAQQLWDHTSKQKGNSVLLRQFVQSVIEAQNVLKQHIQATEQKLKYENNPSDKQQLQADLLSYVNDHKILTQPFNIPHVPDSRAISESKANLAASNRMSAHNGAGDAGWARTSQIFTMAPSEREESWSLKIVFILTAVLLCVQLFVMFHKNHFFNILAYTLIMLIFVQNFFDKLYMRITIIWVALSILLDFLWLIVHSENWWNPYPETQHPTMQKGYLRFSYFLVIVAMIAKALIVILMVRYFNNTETIKKSVTLFSLSFKLDGKSNNNPITQALTGNKQNIEERYNLQ